MPPKTKADTAKFLIGQPDDVLHPEFLHAVIEGKSVDELLPFSGPSRLPTVEQILKLYFYLREKVASQHVSRQRSVTKLHLMC